MTEAVQNHIGSLNWGYRVALREKKVTYENAYGQFVGPHRIKVIVWLVGGGGGKEKVIILMAGKAMVTQTVYVVWWFCSHILQGFPLWGGSVRVLDLGPDYLDLSLGSATYQICDFRQVY